MTPTGALARRQATGSSFYLGMRSLPGPAREAIYAVYAFCREVDDIADDWTGDRSLRAAELEAWREDIRALYAGGNPGRAAFLAHAITAFELARSDFEAVIEGMAMDVVADIRFPSSAELDRYCDRVASAVGRLCIRIFGMESAAGIPLAEHLGRALQLTNILRDIDEDAAVGRVYLPAEAITAAGLPLGPISQVIDDPRIDAACRIVAARAAEHFVEAKRVLARRPSGHLVAPGLMAEVYAALLHRLERRGWAPPRRRVRHSRVALLWHMLNLRLGR